MAYGDSPMDYPERIERDGMNVHHQAEHLEKLNPKPCHYEYHNGHTGERLPHLENERED